MTREVLCRRCGTVLGVEGWWQDGPWMPHLSQLCDSCRETVSQTAARNFEPVARFMRREGYSGSEIGQMALRADEQCRPNNYDRGKEVCRDCAARGRVLENGRCRDCISRRDEFEKEAERRADALERKMRGAGF